MSALYELYLNKAVTKICGYHARHTKDASHILAIIRQKHKGSSLWISVIETDCLMYTEGWKLGWICLIVSGMFYIPLQ